MKSYLKLLALIAAVSLTASFLSACSDDSKPSSSPTPAPEMVKPNS